MNTTKRFQDMTPDEQREYARATQVAYAATRKIRESACRNCGHAAARHDDMGCEGCGNRGRECIGYDPR